MGAILMFLAVAGSPAPQQVTVWGGEHVEMRVTAAGATLEFDCAHGTIAEALHPDAAGGFTAQGTFVPEHAGPSRDDAPASLKATYTGTIKDATLSLKIVVEGHDPEGTAYQLTRDQPGHVRKCR
jgi:hypothetical protein